jgi:hypothetical protein
MVLGLGFEERTIASIERTLAALIPKRVIMIRFEEKGRADEIETIVRTSGSRFDVMGYDSARINGLGRLDGKVLVDVTGLPKPIIFHSLRNALSTNNAAWICHTRAKFHYPLEEDVNQLLDAEASSNIDRLLEAFSKVFTGERGPYELDGLMESSSDEGRRRFLCAFSSPKHERLLTLLDRRSFDSACVFTQDDGSGRARIAKIAAEMASKNFAGTFAESLATNDLQGAVIQIGRMYELWYVDRGFNFEFGLTGSKLQAVACAIAAAALKISQAWYVRPAGFDPARFTKGVGDTKYFSVELALARGPT